MLQVGLITTGVALIALLVSPLIFAPGAADTSEPAFEEGAGCFAVWIEIMERLPFAALR